MDVKMSKEGKEFHDSIIDEISKLPYIEFTNNDGKDKVFHVTLSSKRIQSIYNQLWDYVNQFPCDFNCIFNNVSIYMWNNNTWQLYKEFAI